MTITVESLLEALRQHLLLDTKQLEAVASQQFSDPQALIAELIRRGLLSSFQADLLLENKAEQLVLGSYLLLDKLGEGGMGAVFKAWHRRLGRICAIKVIRKERLADEQAIRRFQREVRAAAVLNHPNVVVAYDADEINGRHLLVMEYIEGIDLNKLVKERGPLPVQVACDYIRQAALGLQHAFEQGIISRDIKPGNLLLATGNVVKILDMGLARLDRGGADDKSSTTLTQEGSVMGTADFISPEQAEDAHTVDIRGDIYSLGCTFYFLLAGRAPFSGSLGEKLLKHVMDEPVPVEQVRGDVPASVAAVVRKMMAKKPEDRFQTPAEVAAVLAEVLAGKIPDGITAIANRPFAVSGKTEEGSLSSLTYMARGGDRKKDEERRLLEKEEERRLIRKGLLAGALLFSLMGLIVGWSLWPSSQPKNDSTDSKASKAKEPGSVVLQFDGVDDLVTLPDNLIRNSQTLTVEAWFKTKRGGVILGCQNEPFPSSPSPHCVPILYVGNDGILRGKYWTTPGAYNPIPSNKSLSDNQWHHIALVANRDSQNLYVDAILNGTISDSSLLTYMTKNQLGMGQGNEGWPSFQAGTWLAFSGSIKEVRIWYIARTQTDIQQDMAKSLTGKEKGLAAYYPMNEATGDLVKDYSPNARDGRLGGGTLKNQPRRVTEDKPLADHWKELETRRAEIADWLERVKIMPPEKQVEEVAKKLRELNPGFDGKVGHRSEGGVVVELQFSTENVTDISPVRALSGLNKLDCHPSWQKVPGRLADLAPLMGMKLTLFNCSRSQVADLSPLNGMPLTTLSCGRTQVVDLSPLKGMPLTTLHCYGPNLTDLGPLKDMLLTKLAIVDSPVSDLTPLQGMPLTNLDCKNTQVSDLTPLRGMPLTNLYCSGTKISDLTPLKDIKLRILEFSTTHHSYRDTEILRSIKTLEKINGQPAAEFWKEVEAKQATFEAWCKEVAAMTADKQAEAVATKLKELNPSFDGKVTHKEENGVVTELTFFTDNITDISPVRALTGLKTLNCNGTDWKKRGKLADLWPLKGMKLTGLSCDYTEIKDLSPLSGMALTSLHCKETNVVDLSPLKNMPLKEISCWFKPERDAGLLRTIKTLEKINGTPIKEFWEGVDNPKTVDLLALIKPEKHAVTGKWRFEGKALVSDLDATGTAQTKIPYTPADEYDLRIVGELNQRGSGFAIGLVIGGETQAVVSLDGGTGPFSGISLINGKDYRMNETTRAGSVFGTSKIPREIICSVRKGRIEVMLDDRGIIMWKGHCKELALPNDYSIFAKTRSLFLNNLFPGFHITKLELTPITGEGKKLE